MVVKNYKTRKLPELSLLYNQLPDTLAETLYAERELIAPMKYFCKYLGFLLGVKEGTAYNYMPSMKTLNALYIDPTPNFKQEDHEYRYSMYVSSLKLSEEKLEKILNAFKETKKDFTITVQPDIITYQEYLAMNK